MVVVVVDTTPNLVFCFGQKLWFWPRPKLNKKKKREKIRTKIAVH